MRTITIEEIINLLPERDADQVMLLLADLEHDRTRDLIAALSPHRTALEQNGMVPEYLAYALPFHIKTMMANRQAACLS
jgi:hypothetical protein